MKVQKSHFTLVELLVVISIIAILAGMLINGLREGPIKAHRAQVSNNLRQMVTSILANETTNRRNSFSTTYAVEDGIRTVTVGEMATGNVVVSGNVIPQETHDYDIFVDYAGSHPFDENGYFIFMGLDGSGNTKVRNDTKTRVGMDVYDWVNKGDYKVSVVFADGHVSVMNVTTPPGEINIAEVLSTKGENDGKL